ncbi:putative serine/threonine-protein kinase kinX [Balamuthia mandrillaris]
MLSSDASPKEKSESSSSGSGRSSFSSSSSSASFSSSSAQQQQQLVEVLAPSDEQAMRPSENWVIDPTKLTTHKEIGRGAFGVVYKGEFLGTVVAVKKLHTSDDDIIKDFLHEVEVMKTLRHPNIVLWMGVHHNEETGELSIVTEFVQNGTLSRYLAEPGDIPWVTRVRMAWEIAQALAYLHDKNLLHRDLKSENILLGVSYECKVADFGLAVLLDRERNIKLSAVGTPWWRAPEVNQYSYDGRADIFSFGIVLGELVLRQDGENIRLGMTYQKKGRLEFGVDSARLRQIIREAAPDCPPALVELTVACCNEDPKDRPTLEEIVKELAELHQGLTALDKRLAELVKDKHGRDLFRSLATASFKSMNGVRVKRSDILQTIAGQLHKDADRSLTEDEINNIDTMFPSSAKSTVTLEEFAPFWKWYSATRNLIMDKRLLGLWKVGFIHGFISRETSTELLTKQNKPKTCIFRFSSSKYGSLVISYITQAGGKVFHDLINTHPHGFSTKSGIMKQTIKKVLTETEPEYKQLNYVYPDVPFSNVAFYDPLGGSSSDADDGYNYNYNVRTK